MSLINSNNLPPQKGSYCLVFQLIEKQRLLIGKIGIIDFLPGYYFYLGSAKGSGGLRARIFRHLQIEKKNFWHLDYLRPNLLFLFAFYSFEINKECDWCQTISTNSGFIKPVQGFGSSDCIRGCSTHLLFSNNLPEETVFAANLLREEPGKEPIFLYKDVSTKVR